MTAALGIVPVCAENTLGITRRSDNILAVELSNTDAVAGIQFSVNGRGGIKLESFQGGDRTSRWGIVVYQYLKDEETLNVVLLAPYRASLPSGTGALGTITLTIAHASSAEPINVFLSNIVLCDVHANELRVSSTPLSWNVADPNGRTASACSIEQNYPNPFNPSTTIVYSLDSPQQVRLGVYDITGRLIDTLVDEYQSAGRYSVVWRARQSGTPNPASGLYVARLQAGREIATQKMLLAK